MARPSKQSHGFTLIELLVVIAIIALLIGILLPAIGRARQTAQALVCSANQRSIGQGMHQYSLENRDFYPGPNTSGASYRFFRNAQEFYGMENESTSATPTAVWDWFSPMLGDSLSLSPNRARRTAQIFNQYGCASSNTYNDFVYGSAIDKSDFLEVQNAEGYLQISYLSPSTFHFYSAAVYEQPLIDPRHVQQHRYWGGFTDPATSPANFRPNMTRVGTSPSAKIFSADGTRYIDQRGQGFALDFDVTSTAREFSSFGSQTPIREESTAYGRSRWPQTDLNVELSIRHNGTVNAVYFDGHVASMTQAEMYENPNPWHPTGSVFTGEGATPESIEFMEEQQGNRSEARIH